MTRKKIESTTKPSQDLINLLQLVNLVPVREELPNPEVRFNSIFEHTAGIRYEKADLENSQEMSHYEFLSRCETIQQIKEETKQYPNLLDDIAFVFGKITGIGHNRTFGDELLYSPYYLDYYTQFFQIRRQVKEFAYYSPEFRMNYVDWLVTGFPLSTQIRIVKGRIVFLQNIIIRALENVEITRLRICQDCHRIFWANRTDKYGCSTKCNQNIRQNRKRKKILNRSRSRVSKLESD